MPTHTKQTHTYILKSLLTTVVRNSWFCLRDRQISLCTRKPVSPNILNKLCLENRYRYSVYISSHFVFDSRPTTFQCLCVDTSTILAHRRKGNYWQLNVCISILMNIIIAPWHVSNNNCFELYIFSCYRANVWEYRLSTSFENHFLLRLFIPPTTQGNFYSSPFVFLFPKARSSISTLSPIPLIFELSIIYQPHCE